MTSTTPGSSGPSFLDEAIEAARQGAWPAARRACRRLVATEPDGWAGWHLASLASAALDRAPSMAPFRRAADLAPERHELWGALAAAYESRQAHDAAIWAARRSLTLAPMAAESAANLGIALKAAAQAGAAASWLDRADALSPGNPAIRNNRAYLHLAAGEDARAAVMLRAVVAAAPTYADARHNLATVERRAGRPGTALRLLAGALQMTPFESDYLAEFGTALVTIGEARIGMTWLRRALSAQPDNAAAMSSLLGALSYAPDAGEAERRAIYAMAATQIGKRTPQAMRPAPRPRADGRLAIGYVSASLHSHPMAAQFVELLRHHDHGRVHVSAYADIRRRDAVTTQISGLVDAWRETTDLDDRALAELIRADGIDVLIFMAPHEEGSRRDLPNRRAAPQQVSLYDIATSGLDSIDIWLTDPILHPANTTEWFSESLARLPSLFLFPDFGDDPPVSPPASRSAVSFASFNNPAKLSEPTLAAWAEILRRVPGSTLTLRYGALFDDPAVAGRVRGAMARHGIDAGRLRLSAGSLPRADHLRAIQQIDIVLDPFPYNGNTATIEALWAGVPVVTLAGTRFLGRMGASILTHAGRAEDIASTAENYVARAVALAADPETRHALRFSLRDTLRRSPLFGARPYAAWTEDALFALARPSPDPAR